MENKLFLKNSSKMKQHDKNLKKKFVANNLPITFAC